MLATAHRSLADLVRQVAASPDLDAMFVGADRAPWRRQVGGVAAEPDPADHVWTREQITADLDVILTEFERARLRRDQSLRAVRTVGPVAVELCISVLDSGSHVLWLRRAESATLLTSPVTCLTA